MKSKNLFNNIVKITLLSLVLSMSMFQLQILPANAAYSAMSNTMSRLQISTSANHTIAFTASGTTNWDVGDTVILDFVAANGFNTGSFAASDPIDYDIKLEGADESLVAAGGCATNDAIEVTTVNTTTDEITFTACPSFTPPTLTGSLNIEIEIGTHATFGGTGNTQVVNPGSTGSKTIKLEGTLESGTDPDGQLAVSIVDSDQVTISATIDPSITFDLDTATTNTETTAPYSVALGTLTTGAVSTSNNSSINSVWVDLATNATGGAVVTVLDANAGLTSTAAGYTINSASVTLVAGAEGYGVCIASVTQTSGSLVKVTPYDGLCNTTTNHAVGALQATAQNILNTATNPIAGGRSEILVKAAISSTTPAANDYTDTLTFIATGTF
jgi:hypothetical protein